MLAATTVNGWGAGATTISRSLRSSKRPVRPEATAFRQPCSSCLTLPVRSSCSNALASIAGITGVAGAEDPGSGATGAAAISSEIERVVNPMGQPFNRMELIHQEQSTR